MAKAYTPTPEELELIRDCLAIEERSPSGLVWLVCRHRVGIEPGDSAFSGPDERGYYRGELSGMRLSAHRVVFFLSRGYWPEDMIDHIDGNKSNNRPDNLRDVTAGINQANRAGRGYNPHGPGFQARIQSGGKWYTKTFPDEVSARRWYEDMKDKLYPQHAGSWCWNGGGQ